MNYNLDKLGELIKDEEKWSLSLNTRGNFLWWVVLILVSSIAIARDTGLGKKQNKRIQAKSRVDICDNFTFYADQQLLSSSAKGKNKKNYNPSRQSRMTCKIQADSKIAEYLNGEMGDCIRKNINRGRYNSSDFNPKIKIDHLGIQSAKRCINSAPGKKSCSNRKLSCHTWALAIDISRIDGEVMDKGKQAKYAKIIKSCCLPKGKNDGNKKCNVVHWKPGVTSKNNTKHENHIHLEIQPQCNIKRKS